MRSEWLREHTEHLMSRLCVNDLAQQNLKLTRSELVSLQWLLSGYCQALGSVGVHIKGVAIAG